LYKDYPVRSYPSDITINSAPELALNMLVRELKASNRLNDIIIRGKELFLKERHDEFLRNVFKGGKCLLCYPDESGYVSACVNNIIDNNTIIVNEYNNR
jgi:hypothetical protein